MAIKEIISIANWADIQRIYGTVGKSIQRYFSFVGKGLTIPRFQSQNRSQIKFRVIL